MNYLILDAASLKDDSVMARKMNPNYECLYIGKKAIHLEAYAPYLFTLTPGSEFFHWIINHPERFKYGIMLHSDEPFKKVWQHFRKFLLVKTDKGKSLYFRFYDSRVLPPFLKTCDQEQLKEFFGPIHSFLCFSNENTQVTLSLDADSNLLVQ